MKKSLLNKLEKYLAGKRRSSGGYAEVRPEDVEGLCAIVRQLIEDKFDRDPDGDLPVEFEIVDRTRFERMHFDTVPYLHKAKTEEEKQAIFDAHVFNLEIAHGSFTNAHRVLRDERSRGKK